MSGEVRARGWVEPHERGETDGSNGSAILPVETVVAVPGPTGGGGAVRVVSSWLAGSRLGLIVMALVVGAGAGLGAVVFRWLIFSFTWLATGYQQFGQQGHIASRHLPWLGIGFLLVIPVVGGLLYGPLIQRFAREARGHGVPEVMLAVAENGAIRPPVSIVKALASAICIGAGGSVGREGPIVQIGSAFASTLGQVVRMSETRLRIIVACGAAGGIAATFNAPITGLFFGFEIVLREFSLDAMFATILAAVTGDLVSRAFFGSAPFFSGMPHGLLVGNDLSYLLIAVLGLASGLIGVAFKTFLYWLEDAADGLWKGRPEWARPAVGGVALGALLLVLPQMYGVGYPVMNKVVAGHVVLWLIVIFMLGKILAASLTLSIGGSGGVFAPSLFTGAMAGMAFGIAANHVFGSSIGSPAMYAVVAMGGGPGRRARPCSPRRQRGEIRVTSPCCRRCSPPGSPPRLDATTYGSIYTTSCAAGESTSNGRKPRTCSRRSQWPRSCSRSRRRRGGSASRRPPTERHAISRRAPRNSSSSSGPWSRSTSPRHCFPTRTSSRRCDNWCCSGATGCRCSRTTVSSCAAGLPARTSCKRWVTGWLPRHPRSSEGRSPPSSPSITPKHVSTRRPPRFRATASPPRRSLPIHRCGGSASRNSSSPPDHCWSPSATADGHGSSQRHAARPRRSGDRAHTCAIQGAGK